MRPMSLDRAFMRGIKVCLSSLERVLHGHLGLVEQLVARFRHTFWPIVESIGHIYMASWSGLKVRRAFCELYLILDQGYVWAEYDLSKGIFVLN